ncbi:MAG: phosphonate ABC transporter, permease protein PhnE [Acidobacteriota bacterium]|nr:MAG: phosphonate ABC transporter, permease protein PhnE [Acidobacteriota bacterium]
MPVLERDGEPIWRRRTGTAALGRWLAWLTVVLTLVVAWRYVSQQTIWEFVWDGPRQAADLVTRMLPPEWSYMDHLWRPLWDTVNIATLGTLLALLLATPVAFLAARNTTPTWLMRPPALLVIVGSRSINSIIWALLLVAIFGPGLFAGILAIAFRSIGFIAKLLYEAIEEIDTDPVEAITATGAARSQVMLWGIVPQIMSAFAGIAVFRWDINIREATVLGLVGAGGIGLQLDASVASLQWARVALILLSIIALVLLSEIVSARLRAASN